MMLRVGETLGAGGKRWKGVSSAPARVATYSAIFYLRKLIISDHRRFISFLFVFNYPRVTCLWGLFHQRVIIRSLPPSSTKFNISLERLYVKFISNPLEVQPITFVCFLNRNVLWKKGRSLVERFMNIEEKGFTMYCQAVQVLERNLIVL